MNTFGENIERLAMAAARRVILDSRPGSDSEVSDSRRIEQVASAIEPALERAVSQALRQAARLAEGTMECSWCSTRDEIAQAIRGLVRETSPPRPVT